MTCPRPFPEELLSGYLDDALTQSESQRVRLHLEDCPACRALLDEMSELRQAAISTLFSTPRDDEWGELPRTPLSQTSRWLGWLTLSLWVAATAIFVAWQMATSPAGWPEKAMAFGSVSGLALLLLSAYLDRRHALQTDRYSRIRR